MVKVYYVKKAAKSNKQYGIKKGKPYWWGKFRRPGQTAGYKVVWLKPPKPSQAEGNPFRRSLLELREQLAENPTIDGANEVADGLDSLADEQSEKFNNLPSSFQTATSGELLEAREQRLRGIADEIRGHVDAADPDPEDEEDGSASDDTLKENLHNIDWSVD